MHRDLQARVEKLEALKPMTPTRVHRLVQDGDDEEMALKRYEQEAGVTVDPDDFVIIRVIVDPLNRGPE
jgi:hypothetical protein